MYLVLVADLLFGFERFLAYGLDIGGIDQVGAQSLMERARNAVQCAAEAHSARLTSRDPAERFLDLVSAALMSGAAHVTQRDGSIPQNANGWGWSKDDFGQKARGERIGFVGGDDLFLNRDAAFRIAKRMAGDASDGLTVSVNTLLRRLKERGHLRSTEAARETLYVRQTDNAPHADVDAEGRAKMIHLDARQILARVFFQPDQTDQTIQMPQAPYGDAGYGQFGQNGHFHQPTQGFDEYADIGPDPGPDVNETAPEYPPDYWHAHRDLQETDPFAGVYEA